jgi:hypothetical protein
MSRREKKGGGTAVAPPPDDGRGVPTLGTAMRQAPGFGMEVLLPRIDGKQPVVDMDIRKALPDLTSAEREPLYNSLREHGLFLPITLVDQQGTYILLDGHERLELWARILADFPDWRPKLPLRADVIPVEDITAGQTDPAVCDCLLLTQRCDVLF